MQKNRDEYIRFGDVVLRAMRIESGLSQGDIAREIGVEPVTVSHWETGQSCPDAVQAFHYYNACKKSQVPFINEWLHPEWREHWIDPDMLHTTIDSLSPQLQEQLYALICHPNFKGLLQLMLCHMELPLRGRIPSAFNVYQLHDLAKRKGTLQRVGARPNEEYLVKCIDEGMQKFIDGEESYSLE